MQQNRSNLTYLSMLVLIINDRFYLFYLNAASMLNFGLIFIINNQNYRAIYNTYSNYCKMKLFQDGQKLNVFWRQHILDKCVPFDFPGKLNYFNSKKFDWSKSGLSRKWGFLRIRWESQSQLMRIKYWKETALRRQLAGLLNSLPTKWRFRKRSRLKFVPDGEKRRVGIYKNRRL